MKLTENKLKQIIEAVINEQATEPCKDPKGLYNMYMELTFAAQALAKEMIREGRNELVNDLISAGEGNDPQLKDQIFADYDGEELIAVAEFLEKYNGASESCKRRWKLLCVDGLRSLDWLDSIEPIEMETDEMLQMMVEPDFYIS